jgi:hypothetical protein
MREVSRPTLRPEEEFEATLGSLVEHFTTLPPPEFGEAPELTAVPAPRTEARPRARRSNALVWVGSLALGATVAGGVMLGLQFARREAAPVVAPAPAPAPRIVVKSLLEEPAPPATPEKGGPAAEPIADPAPALPVAAETAAEETAVKAPASPERNSRKAKRAAPRPRRAGPAGPQVPASTSGDGWEDPYK